MGKPCHWSGGEQFIGILVFYKLSRKRGLFLFRIFHSGNCAGILWSFSCLLNFICYSYCNEGNIWSLGPIRKQLTAVNIVAFNSNCSKYLFFLLEFIKEPCHLRNSNFTQFSLVWKHSSFCDVRMNLAVFIILLLWCCCRGDCGGETPPPPQGAHRCHYPLIRRHRRDHHRRTVCLLAVATITASPGGFQGHPEHRYWPDRFLFPWLTCCAAHVVM